MPNHNEEAVVENAADAPEAEQSDLEEYRKWLNAAELKYAESLDKYLITLSGGALGISLTFIKDVVTTPQEGTIGYLITGWIFLTLSIVATLISLLTTQESLRKAANQVLDGTIHEETPGGTLATATFWLTLFSLGAFVLGIVFLASFAISNMT